MLPWIRDNLATLIVAAVLVAAVALALFFTIRARRRGGSCGCGCSSCPYDCKKKTD